MTDKLNDHRALILAYLSGNATQSEVATFNKLMATDSTFQDLFEQIELETIPAVDDIVTVAPPPELFGDILAEIVEGKESSSAEIIEMPARNPEPWRTVAAISSLVAAAAISLHFIPLSSPSVVEPNAPPSIALLAGADAPSLLVVVYDVEQQKILARLTNAELPQEAVWQLWLIRDGVEVPISLGLLDETNSAGAISLKIDDELLVGEDVLAVSLEPLGGSQQSGPSGPVLFSGKVEAL